MAPGVVTTQNHAAQPALPPNSITWDAEAKETNARLGEMSVLFTFWLTNVSTSEVVVNSVRTSCGCTVAKLPSMPWRIAPGGSGPIEVTLNVQGKSGKIVKSVTVDCSAGVKTLLVTANVPMPNPMAPVSVGLAAISMDRIRNMQISKTDRQAPLKGTCAVCHADPAVGKMSRELFATACAICHNAERRAGDVPDLQTQNKPTAAAYWEKFITEGKPNSMMPAFAQNQGGFLTPEQVSSLVAYLGGDFRKEPRVLNRNPSAARVSPPEATATRPATPIPAEPAQISQ